MQPKFAYSNVPPDVIDVDWAGRQGRVAVNDLLGQGYQSRWRGGLPFEYELGSIAGTISKAHGEGRANQVSRVGKVALREPLVPPPQE